MTNKEKVVKNHRDDNHHANQINPNQGSNGTNQANAKVHGNRGKQLNPNHQG